MTVYSAGLLASPGLRLTTPNAIFSDAGHDRQPVAVLLEKPEPEPAYSAQPSAWGWAVRVESVGEAERRLEEIVRLMRVVPPLSGREIARRVGCSHGYVDKVRRELPARAEPEAPAEPRWRPPGPFSRIDAAERERDELFLQVQALTAERDELRARLGVSA